MLVVYTEHCEPIGDAEGAFSASLQAAYRRFRGNPVYNLGPVDPAYKLHLFSPRI